MKTSRIWATTGLVILGLGATATVLADTREEIDRNVTATLSEFHALNPANESLGKKAAGMLVFPKE